MRRSILLILILLVVTVLVFTQSITVNSPVSRSFWEKGRAYNITWTKIGRMDANVKIRLFDITGRTKILDIVNTTPNDGIYNWSIPESLTSPAYIIRVKTTDNRFSDDSAVFNITSGLPMEVPPTIELRGPEVEILRMNRVGTEVIRLGNMVTVNVMVKNNGGSDADVFAAWITITPPFFDINTRLTHAIISSNRTKEFVLSIPVTPRNFRNGRFTAKVFVGDTRVREQNIIKVLFKDSNMENHQKEFNNIVSSIISIKPRSIRNTYLSNWYTKLPTHVFCTQTMLQPKLDIRTDKVLLGLLNLWKPGADPLPCHNGTHHYFYGAVNFDLSRLRGLVISQAVLKFERSRAIPREVVFYNPNSENPDVAVIQIGLDVIETRHSAFANSSLGKIRPGRFLDVTELIQRLIRREEVRVGFSFQQSSVNLHRYDNDVRLFDYEFELKVTVAE